MTPKTLLLNVGTDGTVAAVQFQQLPRFGIYVIWDGTDVIRIGECSSGEARLKKGFRDPLRRVVRGKDRKNYIAYSWRSKYSGRTVNVDYFELADPSFSDSYLRRALEAEVTFQFRIAAKRWPREMSEIHFLERFRHDPLLVKTAIALLAYYGLSYDRAV